MKHILFTFMLLLASLAGHTQQTNEKSTMNRMENKPKICGISDRFRQINAM